MEKSRKRRKTSETKKSPHITIYTTLWVQAFNTAANAPESAVALQEQRAKSHKNQTAENEKSLGFFLLTFRSTFPNVTQALREKHQLQRLPAAAAPRPPTHRGHQPDSGAPVLTLKRHREARREPCQLHTSELEKQQAFRADVSAFHWLMYA